MEEKPRPAYNTIDLAWSFFVRKSLPKPSAERLLARSRIPQNAMGFFKDFYNIPASVSVVKEYANLDNPGHVTITPPHYIMRINSIYQGWHDAESSIISHELVHVLMNEISVEGRTRWEDEIFTDTFAVFLGAGLIANFKVSVDFYKDSTMIRSMGYLNQQERAYALARFIDEAGITLPEHPSGEWRSSDLEGIRQSLLILRKRKTTNQIKKNHSSGLVCPRCESPCSFFEKKPSIFVSCQECGLLWKKGWWSYRCVNS
jgi:hypothetical protein